MGASAREAQPLRLKLFFFSRDADGTVDERTRLVDPQVELLRDVPATVGAELVIGVEARLPLRMSACERAGVPQRRASRCSSPVHRCTATAAWSAPGLWMARRLSMLGERAAAAAAARRAAGL